MVWHDISDPNGSELDQLAERYKLHPLHIEDCRGAGQRAKVEVADHYLFIVLKVLLLEGNNKLTVGDVDLFVGSEFLITVHSAFVPGMDALRQSGKDLRSDEVLYRLMDGVVDSYLPLLDELQVRIDTLQSRTVSAPESNLLTQMNEIRVTLLELRRVLLNMRHVAFHLQHTRSQLVGPELPLFLRDVHDHLGEDLDTIAGERDRLAGVLDVYLSSVANRNTEATWTLTLLGTAALPALVIASFFGMNVPYPGWVSSSWAFPFILSFTIIVTALSLWYLKRQNHS
jgi:magnesium transporter